MKNFFSKIYLIYLRILVKIFLSRNKIRFIGLTGSVGKTTLTIALHSLLQTKYRTKMTYSQGHGLNSETGLPFAILDVHIDKYALLDWIKYSFSALFNSFLGKTDCEIFIAELGVDKPFDMDYLLKLIKPETGIFLSIAKMHTANFEDYAKIVNKDSYELLFEEKSKLVTLLDKKNSAVLNADDLKISSLKNQTDADVVTFGLSKNADIRGEIKSLSSEIFQGYVVFDKKRYLLEINKYFVNKQFFLTLLASFAVGVHYGVSPEACIEILKNLELPPGRMTKISGIKDTLIIDSSYNASKPAIFEALDNLNLFKNRKKIAILGDIRELGEDSKLEHEEVADKAIQVSDAIVTIGPNMKKYFFPQALAKGFKKENIYTFSNTWEALEFIKNELIKGGEVILVKGSQNTLFLEIIVEGLMKNPKDAEKLLARRGKHWDQKRQELRNY